MRRQTVPLVLVLMAGLASARPRRVDADFVPDPFEPRYDTCESSKSWPKLRSCLARGGNTVTVLHEVDAARLVSVRAPGGPDVAAIYLYLLRDGLWRKANVHATLGPTTELLSFKRFTKSRAYTLEIGNVTMTSSMIGDSSVRVTLRRIVSTVCLDDASYCRTLVSRCDALVDGKTYWSFRGRLVVDQGTVRLTGDTSHAGAVCAPARSLLTQAPSGDPLE